MPAHPAPGWAADPSARLLVAACSVAPVELPVDREPDWEWLLAAAERHAVLPLLARRLPELGAGGAVPPHIAARLRARYDENALRNLAFTGTLAELLGRLAGAGVEAMPIKGPALAISAYGDLALRQFGDLDIVVRPADFGRARSLLGEWGYRAPPELTDAGERTLRSSDHHLPLAHDESKLRVELHWSLDNGRPGRILDGDWVWANARTVSLLGREVPALSWSALLVYLCVHGAKHGWTNLGWIRDVAGVLAAAPAGELAGAARLATAADARRRLALGVALARSLLAAPARDDLRPEGGAEVARLEGEVRAGMFDEAGAGRLQALAFQCRTFDTLRDRAGLCWHVLAAPHAADVDAVKLPAWLRGLYFLARPARLAAKYGRRIARGEGREM